MKKIYLSLLAIVLLSACGKPADITEMSPEQAAATISASDGYKTPNSPLKLVAVDSNGYALIVQDVDTGCFYIRRNNVVTPMVTQTGYKCATSATPANVAPYPSSTQPINSPH